MSSNARKRKVSESSDKLVLAGDEGFTMDNAINLANGDDEVEELSDSAISDAEEESQSETEPFPALDPSSDSESTGYTSIDEEELEDSSRGSINPFPQARTVISGITGQPKRQYPEIEPDYDSDSSTEEDPNRIGNVPLHWYDELPHIGYNINGKKVLRPAKGDELDRFLSTADDSNLWNTAFDEKSQMVRPLTADELDIIRRLQEGEIPLAGYDPYEPTIEWFTGKGKEEVMPLTAAPEPKRRWVPSKWEKQKVMKIVRAIRQGRILPHKPKTDPNASKFYNIWGADNTSSAATAPTPAPRRPLPTNSESYNPPPEYLPNDQERNDWEKTDPEDRDRDYLPCAHDALRHVPAYDQFIQERFNRQLDLYLAPRIQRTRLNIDPDSLLPKLPTPSSLRPFPVYKALRVLHHARVRCISTSPDGYWAATGDDQGQVCLWETTVGMQVESWTFKSKITAIEWCPRNDVSYFVVATGETLEAVVPKNLSKGVLKATHTLLKPAELPPPLVDTSVKWHSGVSSDGLPLGIHLPPSSGTVKQVAFHRRGDYLATVSEGSGQTSVWIHQIAKRHSQSPFRKVKGTVQKVLFHPTKARFFVATQRYVRIYDLAAQKLLKTLQPGIRWISCMDVHISGDHLLVAGYDRKLCWFDLELSDKPYKVMRYHSRAVRAVCFHPSYPLFASCSDDGAIQVFHARVYNDLMTDPLIVPLKILRGHTVTDGLGVLDLRWCAGAPWLVSAGADGNSVVWMS